MDVNSETLQERKTDGELTIVNIENHSTRAGVVEWTPIVTAISRKNSLPPSPEKNVTLYSVDKGTVIYTEFVFIV